MSENSVYITRIAKFLPNSPVLNDEMEDFLGKINGAPSKAKFIVLRNNGIKKRYYALNKNGESTHSNAELTAYAISQLTDSSFSVDDIQLLACGTTSPDFLLPSHASMVQGLIKGKPIEILSAAGACNAGMQALKYGYLSVMSGNTTNAVCTGSEKISTWMTAKNFEKEAEKIQELEKYPILAFEKEFLRWMLSDGAAAVLLENKPNEKGISLKVEWIDFYSFANEIETCMYAGGEKENEKVKPWRDYSLTEIEQKSIFSLKQDVKLLDYNIVRLSVLKLIDVLKKRNLPLENIDYFLPHISSMYFKNKIKEELAKHNLEIPEEKWFLNLPKVGNVGAASIYMMIEDLVQSGKLKKGQKIFLSVPESARFSYAYALLTVC